MTSSAQSNDGLIGTVLLAPAANECCCCIQVENLSTFDFIWETTCQKKLRQQHNSATVANRLHNNHILENKSNFAFLQEGIKNNSCFRYEDLLDTYVALSSKEVHDWCFKYWVCITMLYFEANLLSHCFPDRLPKRLRRKTILGGQ